MRKIIVLEFMSLDGVIQAPGDPKEDTSGSFTYGGWTVPYSDEVLDNVMAEQMKMPFELLLGRKTYEIFASYWPHHGEMWPGVNETKKYVAAHGEISLTWEHSTLLKENVVEEIKKLKSESGPNLHVYGSGNFVQTLLKNDLVDELWLKIYPVTLGSGKRLFAEGSTPAAFELYDSKISTKGVIIGSYKRAGKVETGSFV